MEAIDKKLKALALESFREGMFFASELKWHCEPNECDGVDAMKQKIREAAANLKELPPVITTQEKL